jgi:homogentisate 1,2-dioxygenase
VASNTFRLPYFHRNSASEFLACLYGNGLGRSDDFKPGGGSFEGGHTPHGGFSDGYVNEMKIQTNQPRRILESELRKNGREFEDEALLIRDRPNDYHD